MPEANVTEHLKMLVKGGLASIRFAVLNGVQRRPLHPLIVQGTGVIPGHNKVSCVPAYTLQRERILY